MARLLPTGQHARNGGSRRHRPAHRRKSLPSRALGAFGRFWWDFLVGETPELFVGVLVVVGIVAALAHGARTAAIVLAPVLVIALLVVSVRRGAREG